ncbi:LCP family protein [Blastococcus goldschmidtiae]|uniref:LCP family protein n=1 Tax=Blastococcus goldschmidtiae TaxID=3075546 RepID=A0ABU2KDE7_9ACTN|nr:LCP family protein [Blastococcus sp. DSM 46792]MDT0278210.1 LCP family protein [Blastococcus sp. DSM 46792]
MTADGPRRLPPHLDPRRGPGADGPVRSTRGPAVARSVAAVLSGLLLLGSGWGWHLARVAEASVQRADAIPSTGNEDINGEDHAGEEMNLLLVGMDSRTGLTPEQQQEFSTGEADGVLNTDSMMLVHVPADGSAASFVSLPRDTYVDIPGFGEGRLNSAYARGFAEAEGSEEERRAAGARRLIQTVSGFTGLEIDHFAEIDLLGFINLSEIVGGVEVNLCQATSDPLSGADFPAGVQTIGGADALAFVRQRSGLPGSDLDRVVRQQVYIAGMLRNMLSTDLLLDLGKQREIVEQVGSSVTLDQGLDIFDLAAQMQGVDPGNITFRTIPGLTPARIDGAEVLQPPGAEEVRRFFFDLGTEPADEPAAPEDGEDTAVSPGEVTVRVINGSGVSGAAATTATELADAGFEAAADGNAEPTATTTIRHRTGDDAAAALVAARVPGAAVTVDDLPEATVALVLGADYNGIGQAVTAPAPSGDGAAETGRTADDVSCIN